jgi:hypothetical protein
VHANVHFKIPVVPKCPSSGSEDTASGAREVRNVPRRGVEARNVALTNRRDVGERLQGGTAIGGHVHHRSEAGPDPAAQERGISVVEQPTVCRAEPVTPAGRHCRHGHDRLGEMNRPVDP